MDIDNEDYLNFQAELEIYKKEYLTEAQKEAEKIYKENIDTMVYQSYQPVQYERTYALEDSVTSTLEGDTVYLYNNGSNADYYSAVSGEVVGMNNIVKFINYGHQDSSGIGGMFHDYPARGFIEQTKEDIENEMPDIKVEILNEGE